MTNTILIQGARAIDPTLSTDQVVDILIRNGRIEALGQSLPKEGVELFDARGLVITPGFIDLHAHLREPGQEEKETLVTGAAAAARGGFTTVCCMPNTVPAIDSATVVRFILSQAKLAGPIRILPIAAITRGREGKSLTDMDELARAGAVAFSDDGNPLANGYLMQMALEYAKDLGLPVIDHCEDRQISHSKGMHDGWVSARLGLPGYPSAAEESMIARDIALAELTGGHFHAAHVSTSGGVDLLRQAKSRGLHVTAEVTPHHLTLSEEWVFGSREQENAYTALTPFAYDTRAKVSPPLRTIADKEALIVGLRDGVIDAVATDHAPHTFADKALTFEEATVGISVLETAFGSLMRLVHGGVLDLPTLIHRLTVGATKVLGAPYASLATLQPGTPADLVLFDPNKEWTVDTVSFVSKGLNTPLDGVSLKGRVIATIAAGEIVYDQRKERATRLEGS